MRGYAQAHTRGSVVLLILYLLWSRVGATTPPSLKTKGIRGKTFLENITYQQPPHMGSSESQDSMGRYPGQNAGMLCRLCCIQGSTSLRTSKSRINTTILLLLQNSPKTLKIHLQGSWTFNFHSVYEKKLFLVIKENQSWSTLSSLTPRAALSILQSLLPHLYACLFSLSNMYHSLKSLGDKSVWTPDENACRIIFSTSSIHISPHWIGKKQRIN